jgi:hypothetical protein
MRGLGANIHPSGYLRRIWKDDACRQLRDALNAAWGEIPNDPPVQPVVQRGEVAGSWSIWPAAPATCWSWARAAVVR